MLNIVGDENIVDDDVVFSNLRNVLVIAKACTIPNTEQLEKIKSEVATLSKILARIEDYRLKSKISVAYSKAEVMPMLKATDAPIGMDNRLTHDKSVYNNAVFNKHLEEKRIEVIRKIESLWIAAKSIAEDLTNPDQSQELQKAYNNAMCQAKETDVMLEYANTDSPLEKQIDKAIMKKKEGKQSLLLRVACDHTFETAVDFLQICMKPDAVIMIQNRYERIQEMLSQETETVLIKDKLVDIVDYAKQIKDYNTAVKWCVKSVLKTTFANHE